MPTPQADKAANDALKAGAAILKFISPNEAGTTGSNQRGFYLPKAAWKHFTPNPPRKGTNADHDITVRWPDGSKTNSRIVWYGKGSRSEYRMTRFGDDFRFLNPDVVGDLLVLVPSDTANFTAHILDREEDIEALQQALGVEVIERWAVYDRDAEDPIDDCLLKHFKAFAASVDHEFPDGAAFSAATRTALEDCVAKFGTRSPDSILLKSIETEYQLFRYVEKQICLPEISQKFTKVDDFLAVAKRILNRRASRAGRSFENHVAWLLKQAGIPHSMRNRSIRGAPAVVSRSHEDDNDPNLPREKIIIDDVNTTFKDRGMQIMNTAPKVEKRWLMTLQDGVSVRQLDEMHEAGVTLIVPKAKHLSYPRERRDRILTIEQFFAKVRATL